MQPQPLVSGPLSVADILDRTFRLYRHYFRHLIVSPLLLYVPLGLVQIAAVFSASTGAMADSILFSFIEIVGSIPVDENGNIEAVIIMALVLIGLAGGVAAIALINAAYIQAVYVIRGEPLAVGPALRQGLRRFWPVIGIGLLAFVAILPLFMLAAVFPCLLIGIIPLFIYVACRMTVATGVFYAEEAGPFESFRTSWRLTDGYVWRSIGFTLLLAILSAAINSGIGAAVGFIFELTLPFVLGNSISIAITTAINALWLPIGMLAAMLYYYDLRVRQDGYDLAMRVDNLVSAVESSDRPNDKMAE